MLKNITKQISSSLSALKTTYSQQGQIARVLIPALFLLAFCCLCSILFSLFPRGNPSNALPSPNVFPSAGAQATPTALFDFDFPTFTPFPTLPPPSAFPTLTPPPTDTQAPTQTAPAATATETPVPTDTATQVPPSVTATATSAASVVILAVHKTAENVDIQNISPAAVDLSGWRLVSETGDQSCELSGTLKPGEVLKVWANRGPGFDCRFPDDIWMDNELDRAVLYNPQGEAVSIFP